MLYFSLQRILPFQRQSHDDEDEEDDMMRMRMWVKSKDQGIGDEIPSWDQKRRSSASLPFFLPVSNFRTFLNVIIGVLHDSSPWLLCP